MFFLRGARGPRGLATAHVAVAAALLLTGCTGSAAEDSTPELGEEPAPQPAEQPAPQQAEDTDWSQDLDALLEARGVSMTVDDLLVGSASGQPVRLASKPWGALMGWLSPAGVLSPDASAIAYSEWVQHRADDPGQAWSDQGIEPGERLATPTIRLHDLRTGADDVVVRGGYSVAWREDGAVAYMAGDVADYQAHRDYLGHLLVAEDGFGSPAQPWTTEASTYVAAAWAGAVLLGYEMAEGEVRLLALDGPGRVRVLDPRGHLVAVSPDGSSAAVADSTEPVVRIVDVADGTTTATLDLGSDSPVTSVSYAGSWVGDRIAVRTSHGVAVLQHDGGALSMLRLLPIDPAAHPEGATEPQLSADGAHVLAWVTRANEPDASGVYSTTTMDCEVEAGTCSPAAAIPTPFAHPVSNPSRPLGTGV